MYSTPASVLNVKCFAEVLNHLKYVSPQIHTYIIVLFEVFHNGK
jgi:hypothetical protein